jgi:hypothetical protein
MLGPVLGQALFTRVGFEFMFYIFAGMLSLVLIILTIMIPSYINYADDILSKAEIDLYFD